MSSISTPSNPLRAYRSFSYVPVYVSGVVMAGPSRVSHVHESYPYSVPFPLTPPFGTLYPAPYVTPSAPLLCSLTPTPTLFLGRGRRSIRAGVPWLLCYRVGGSPMPVLEPASCAKKRCDGQG